MLDYRLLTFNREYADTVWIRNLKPGTEEQ
jgi:hypothetical protein